MESILRLFTSFRVTDEGFRMTIAPYVILSGSEESLLLSRINSHAQNESLPENYSLG